MDAVPDVEREAGPRRRPLAGTTALLLLLVLLALVAAAAGGGRSLTGERAELGTPQLLVDYVYSALIVLGALLVLAFVALVLMTRRGPLPAKSGSATGFLVGLALIALAVGFSRTFDRSPFSSGEEGIVRLPQLEQPLEPLPEDRREGFDDPSFRWEVLAVVGGLAVLAALLLLRRWPRDEDEPKEDAAWVVSGVVDEALDDLRAEPDARRAVIAAYARLEGTLAHHGLPRRPSEAPLEYLARVLLALRVRPEAVLDLTDLFEQAKFSRRRIDAAMKDEAIDALVAVRDDLRMAA